MAEHETNRYMLIEPVWCACSPVHLGASQTCYCLSVELTCPTCELSTIEARQKKIFGNPALSGRTPYFIFFFLSSSLSRFDPRKKRKRYEKRGKALQNPTYVRGWRLLGRKDHARSRTQPNESDHQPETAMHHPSKNHERAFNLSIQTKF